MRTTGKNYHYLVHDPLSPSDNETQHNPTYYERLLYYSSQKKSNSFIISSMLMEQKWMRTVKLPSHHKTVSEK